MRIGILAVQGAVAEHKAAVERTLQMKKLEGEVVLVRDRGALESSDALIIPGGESTTISKLIVKFQLADLIKHRVKAENFPVMGTCAGSILLASKGDEEVKKTGTILLELMDFSVVRNAFGSQRESFEMPLTIKGIAPESQPFPGVFIRAPLIMETRGSCESLGSLPDGTGIIAARQNKLLALVFHPELTGDLRIHEYFIETI
ncbi:MAG: pyridoxal 5'-phosphate synthase glutaminase subunit PdxT [Thermoplasmata archaeon]|nr:MAG: pyridoxal 5'-phosphate synthase glutaminase subunit PdxT [Thermoplasmata archaeon]